MDSLTVMVSQGEASYLVGWIVGIDSVTIADHGMTPLQRLAFLIQLGGELQGEPAYAGWHLKDARIVTNELMSCTKDGDSLPVKAPRSP